MNKLNEKEIIDWLNKRLIKNYMIEKEIHGENVVNVFGNVGLSGFNLTELPIKFGTVHGDFDISINKLTTLKNCPNSILGSFLANDNLLETLEHFPQAVHKHIHLYNNKLNSLKFLPSHTHGDLCIDNNKITSFEHISRIIYGKLIAHINNFQNFDFFPEYVGERININYNMKLKPFSHIENFTKLKAELAYNELSNTIECKPNTIKKMKI